MISEIISEFLYDCRNYLGNSKLSQKWSRKNFMISEIIYDLGNYLLGSPFSAFVVQVMQAALQAGLHRPYLGVTARWKRLVAFFTLQARPVPVLPQWSHFFSLEKISTIGPALVWLTSKLYVAISQTDILFRYGSREAKLYRKSYFFRSISWNILILTDW